jgi:hypothetical protein
MQAQQLKSLIESYSDALAAASAREPSLRIARLARVIGIGGTQTAAKFFEKMNKTGFQHVGDEECDVSDLVPILDRLLHLLTEAGGKKAAITDVQILLDLIRRSSEFSLNDIESVALVSVASASRGKTKPGEQPVDTEQLVQAYLKRLDAARGRDTEFRSIYKELTDDRRIGSAEAVAIASKFYQPVPASTSRPKALQTILRRHEKLMESRAASSTIGGKAA